MTASQNAPTAQAKTQSETFRPTTGRYSYERSVVDVHQEFEQLDPQAISDACRAWKRAADELLALADGLKAQAAVPLSAAWTSPASPNAQTQLQHSEATVRALANDCMQMAHATDYAAQYAQWYKDNLPSYTDSLASGVKGLVTGDGLTAGASAATQYMMNLLGRYDEVIKILPPGAQATLVNSRKETIELPPPPPPGGGGVGGTQAPTIPGRHGGIPNGSGIPAGSGVPGPGWDSGVGTGVGSGVPGGPGIGSETLGDPYAAGSSLAGTGLGGGLSGFEPSGLGSAGGGFGGASGLGAGFGAGALGATGLGAGGLAGGLGAGRGLSGVSGAGGAGSLGGMGGGGLPAGALSAEQAAASGAGRQGMMPMHGSGGQGGGEEERERSTWLVEDDDVWGTGGDVPPPVITS